MPTPALPGPVRPHVICRTMTRQTMTRLTMPSPTITAEPGQIQRPCLDTPRHAKPGRPRRAPPDQTSTQGFHVSPAIISSTQSRQSTLSFSYDGPWQRLHIGLPARGFSQPVEALRSFSPSFQRSFGGTASFLTAAWKIQASYAVSMISTSFCLIGLSATRLASEAEPGRN